ncbi:MAG: allene oxide cyclase barrel-like domain-containing protein, partial [Gammaproteobacteria bacterium]
YIAVLVGIMVLLVVSGVQPTARADKGEGERSSFKIIVLTGDHAGADTLGLDTEIDESSTTNGVGDMDLFSDDLRYKKNGEVAGRNSGVCITTSSFGTNDPSPAHQGANLCTLGFTLFDRGKITVSGIVTNDDFSAGVIVLPVTGGTGEFRHAQGNLEVKFAPVFTDPATLTFRLRKDVKDIDD